jgi:hypothetical protein
MELIAPPLSMCLNSTRPMHSTIINTVEKICTLTNDAVDRYMWHNVEQSEGEGFLSYIQPYHD